MYIFNFIFGLFAVFLTSDADSEVQPVSAAMHGRPTQWKYNSSYY